MQINFPGGGKKTTIKSPQNSNIFDDDKTKLQKRKAELEAKATSGNAQGNNKPDLSRLTRAEREELQEINNQLQGSSTLSKENSFNGIKQSIFTIKSEDTN